MLEIADSKRPQPVKAMLADSYDRLLADLETWKQRSQALQRQPAGERRDREVRLLQLEREQLDQHRQRLEEVRKHVA